MKFRFNKPGLVSSGEVELGELTVSCGDNNTGKTYVAFAIYGYCRQGYELNDSSRSVQEDHPLVSEGINIGYSDNERAKIAMDRNNLSALMPGIAP